MNISVRLSTAISMLFFFLWCSCNNTDELAPTSCDVTVDFDGSSIRFCSADPSDVNVQPTRVQDEFIWQAMNLYYYYQDEVNALADDRFNEYGELYSFLNSFESSFELYNEGLKVSSDRFSRIFSDYRVREDQQRGVSTSFGYYARLVSITEGSNEKYGFIQYVIPGGPADNAGLKRGDLFIAVDGFKITEDNYLELLTSKTSYVLSLATLDNGTATISNQKVSLTAVELTENPILLDKVIEEGGGKVGYLAYNRFINTNEAHQQLNEVFGRFNSEGITDLVLDLRYNPGGSITTTRILASLIHGNTSESDLLGTIVYNDKLGPFFNAPVQFLESLPTIDENGDVIGQEPLNRLLNLSRVFVLTSGGTASASELLIVGLNPYMDVTTIGTTTVGKNEGSALLYDSKASLFLNGQNAEINDEHRYAIQPIISRVANSVGFSDYQEGLEPDFILDEKNFIDDLKPLGDPDEPLLAEALSIIRGTARKGQSQIIGADFEYIDYDRISYQDIIIEKDYLPNPFK